MGVARRTEETRLNTPDKKFLVEEIKKAAAQEGGKKVEKSSTKKEPKCSFFKKRSNKKKSQICSRTVDKRKMEMSLLIYFLYIFLHFIHMLKNNTSN